MDSHERVFVVTGASSGIGAAAAVELARRGGTVVPVGRDERRLARVADRIATAGGRAEEPLSADFASLAHVRRLASELLERHRRIDVLVNNAGTYAHRRELTEDGHERTFAVNHLAPFLLTNLLLDRLRSSEQARVVVTASDAHRGGVLDFDDLELERRWSGLRAYANSKLANVLFTRALARRLEDGRGVANCFHPGVVATRLVRGGLAALAWVPVRVVGRRPRSGADTLVYLAHSLEAGDFTGEYFVDRRPSTLLGQAADGHAAELLWERSEAMVGMRGEG
jgi:NAD(P)-dependent dehydrogenase (short-subunit alcohol dehydrogenase family)